MNQHPFSNQFFDQIKDRIWTINSEFQLIYANKAYFDSIKEATGEETKLNESVFIERFSNDVIDKWKAYYKRAFSGETFEIQEHFYNPKTNETYYSEITFYPLTHTNGETQSVTCQSHDVTTIVEQMTESKQLMDASLDTFCTINESGDFVFVSAACADHWGYLPEELIGKAYEGFILEEDIPKTREIAEEIVGGKDIRTFENRYVKKDGSIAYNLWSARWDDEAKLMYCVARDGKEKMAEEQKLRLFEKVINSTSDSIIVTEAEPLSEPGPRIVYVNKAFSEHTGYSADEVLGENPRIFQGPGSNLSELKLLGEKLRRWEPSEITVLNYKKSGEPFWVNFAVSPVTDENGWHTHWISVQRDVTEQKNRELEKDLLSQISLDFSNEEDLTSSATKICESISGFGKFDLIELWCPNMEQNELQLTGQYIKSQLVSKGNNSVGPFKKGEGLPGRVWKGKKQLLWGEKEINKYFTRKKVATEIGLKSLFGVPLTYKNDVVGVLFIGTTKEKNYLNKYSEILTRLQGFIGSEINRKSLEYDLKYLYNAIPEILCVSDFNGRFLRINTAVCDLLGYSEEEVLYHSCHDFIHPDDKKSTVNKLSKLANGSNNEQFENRYITKKGKILWLSWSCSPDIHSGLIYASAKNITEQKKLNELYRQTRLLAKVGSWEYDLVEDDLFWSEEVHHLHETDPATYVPNVAKAIEWYKEEHKPYVADVITKSITEGVHLDYEAVIVSRSRKEKWIRVIGSPQFDGGKCVKFIGSFQDLTESKESEIRLESLANNLPGVAFQYEIRPDGTDALLHVTKGALKTWGFLPEKVMANNSLVWDQIALGGDLQAVQDSIADSITNKTTWNAHWRYVMPNKEVAMHVGYGTPVFFADGRVVFHSVILDVTEESKNELLLKQVSNLAKIGGWELNLESMKPYFSEQTFQIYELPIGSPPEIEDGIKFYDKEARPIIQKAVEEAIKNHKPYDLELPFTTAKGNKIWVKTSGNVELVDGKAVRLYGGIQDITERKQAELKIRESEAKFRSIFEIATIGIAKVDAKEGRIITVNSFYEKLTGYSVDELLNMKFAELTHPDDREEDWELFTKALGGEIEYKNEKRYIKKDGSVIWVRIHVGFIREKSGVPLRTVAICENITDRKKAEEDLLTSVQRTRLAADAANIGVFDWDIKLNKLIWDEKMYEIFNVNPSEFSGAFEAWEATVHPEDIEKASKDVEDAISGVRDFDSIFRIIWKDQSVRYIKGNAQITRDLNGNAIRMIGTNWDITREKVAEQTILQANERFEKVTEATNDIIWDWDIVNENFYCSSAIDRFLGEGTAKSTTIEDVWKHFLNEEDATIVKKSLYNSMEDMSCTHWEHEFRLLTHDKKIVYIIDRARIIRNDKGKAIRMVGAKTDITEQKELELLLKSINQTLQKHAVELERSNQELEQFAFVSSHDLQEPLRMITSFMDLLKRNYGDQLDDKALQYIYLATDGAKRMKQIILDLLLYSRANKPEQELEEVDLNETLSDFKQLRKKVIVEKAVVIHSDKLPIIRTHKAPIIQVFHGLLDNAIKYAKSQISPIIKINFKEKRNEWEISINDNGIGIDKEFHEKIFGIFQRLHNREEYEGTGIGLAVVKRSVEFLGGTIWVTSKLGEGSTFHFTIKKQQAISEQYEK